MTGMRSALPGRPAVDGVAALSRSRVVALDRSRFEVDPGLVPRQRGARIRCPHCRWQPLRTSRWTCTPAGSPENLPMGCGVAWNTFETRGVCPGCHYRWRNTQCLSCGRWAAHEDWYTPEGEGRPPGRTP